MSNGMVFNHLPEMPGKIRKAANLLVNKGGFDVQAEAQRGAPVKWGLLKNSIYTVTSDKTGQLPAIPAAYRDRKDVLFPVVNATGDPLRALVVVGAKYGVFVHDGTRFMPARPFLMQAALKVWPAYQDSWRRFEGLLR